MAISNYLMRWRFSNSPDCLAHECHDTVKTLCRDCNNTTIKKGTCTACGSNDILKDVCRDCRINLVALERFFTPLLGMLYG